MPSHLAPWAQHEGSSTAAKLRVCPATHDAAAPTIPDMFPACRAVPGLTVRQYHHHCLMPPLRVAVSVVAGVSVIAAASVGAGHGVRWRRPRSGGGNARLPYGHAIAAGGILEMPNQ